jgi:flagellar motility protein MotE (MotC chaperone)
MKTVIIMSIVTFLVIFGGITYTSGMLEDVMKISSLTNVRPGQSEIDRVLSNLTIEKDRIEKESSELAKKTYELSVEKKFVETEKKNIENMIAQLNELNSEFTSNRDESSEQLTKLYESMKPAKAASILLAMDSDVVFEILNKMKSRQAAKIMSYLDPELAAKVSSRMSKKGFSDESSS